ncbi:hypothetical protein Z946_3834 [Sulfitobacter noctilucicola]|nr:hypothetical protein Z946_3834 [Sulfitobacter noctilucicola]
MNKGLHLHAGDAIADPACFMDEEAGRWQAKPARYLDLPDQPP